MDGSSGRRGTYEQRVLGQADVDSPVPPVLQMSQDRAGVGAVPDGALADDECGIGSGIMGRTEQIICDSQHCQKDLTYTGNCEDYRLVLRSQSKTPWYVREGRSGGAVTAMAITPPVARPYYFCGLECLKQWFREQQP